MKLFFSSLIFAWALVLGSICFGTDAPPASAPAPVSEEAPVTAAEANRMWSIEVGVGVNTSTGMIGAKVRREFGDHFYGAAGGGIDFRSSVLSLGGGWQTRPRPSTCFFFFDCTKKFLIETSYVYFPESTKDKTASSGSHGECEHWWHCEYSGDGTPSSDATYHVSSSSALNASLVWQDLFGKNFFYEFELGYLALLSESNVDRVSGTGTIATGRSSGLSLGIKFGRYF